MANKKYLLKPITGTIKGGFTLVDENEKLVYEARMSKFKLFGASPYDFTNYLTNKKEEHKVGKTVTQEESGLASAISTKSYFKFDGENIWDYLHDKGIRIDSSLADRKIGMSYDVTFEGKPFAKIASSSPKGKSFITTSMFYDLECDEKDLDLAFLVAFAIGSTEQIFYN